MQTGTLIVQVSASRGVIPIEGATVIIEQNYGDSKKLLKSLTTNSSGETDMVTIDTPDRELSEKPGNVNPFANVNIRASYPGYYSVTNNDVPVFSGIETIQQINLIPLLENEKSGSITRDFKDSDQYNL